MSSIVLGLGFGDEGKGLTTSYLCSTYSKPIVVRFNGGHQAGHTVLIDSMKHVFSTYGAGTLQGVPTYWSKYCTLYPVAVVNENIALKRVWNKKEPIPTIYVHPLAPVTTPFDVWENRSQEMKRYRPHGSVGVGFGQTIQRHEDFYKIHAQDLFYPSVLRAKLGNVIGYYQLSWTKEIDYEVEKFLEHVEECKKLIRISDESILYDYDLVFEGAQGILLDQDFGFFPNVTRSNTTSKNAMEILSSIRKKSKVEVYYVTRSYQTRHGNGFMTNENCSSVVLKNNEDETNKLHDFQGEFRIGKLDTELLRYSLACDSHFSKFSHKNLVVTCLDQHYIDVNELRRELSQDTFFEETFISRSPDSSKIVKF